MINNFTVEGNLTRDMEVKYTNSGLAVGNFSIANSVYGGKDKPDYVSFFDVVIWGKRAEALAQYLKKGLRVFICAEMRMESWNDNQGKARKTFKINMRPQDVISFGSSPNRGEQATTNQPQSNYIRSPGQNQQQNSSVRSGELFTTNPQFEDDIPF